MIKYNNSNINDWNFGDSNIAKVYYGVTSGSSRLPQGYTEVEYIESPTKSEYPYIDTGFKPNQNTRVIADFQYTQTNTHPRCFGCGEWNSTGYIFNAENGISSNGEWKWKFGSNGNTWLSTSVVPNFNRHTVEINNGNLYLDDALIGSTTVTAFQLTDNIGLFGFIKNGSLGGVGAGEYMTGKFYSFKIYDDGTLVRDFVPCLRDNDNMVGMYDIVNDAFYFSANSYQFVAGSTVTPSSTTIGNVVYQKITNGSTPPTPSTFSGKWLATYSDSTTSSADCDSTSAITQNEIALNNLVSVEIGDCVTSIGYTAFFRCNSLTSCTIGSGVTSIGAQAFYGCTGLTGIAVNASVPPTLGPGVFNDTDDCPIYVPAASVSAYQSEWSRYASRIQAIT